MNDELFERLGGFLLFAERLPAEVLLAFGSATGGESTGEYGSLNFSYAVGDDRSKVRRNRKIVTELLAFPLGRLTVPIQTHGARCHTVHDYDAGRGAFDQESGIPSTDALLSTASNSYLCIQTADCLPVAIIAPGPAIAMVHAGWRGVLSLISSISASRLASAASCQADRLVAVIGPHIRSCCMEADWRTAGAFSRVFGPTCLLEEGGTFRIDLERATRTQLQRVGMKDENIHSTGICTVCDNDYFSFRRSGGSCGRQATILGIR